MTDTTAIPEPFALYQGQPISREQAGAQLAALRADPKFLERIEARDANAFAENTRLYRLSIGMTAEPQAPINAMDVMTESVGRELQDVQMRAESLRNDGFSPVQIYEYLNDRPMPLAQREIHQRELQALKSDPDFVRRFLGGNLSARAEMRRVTAALTMRVGTLDEINAWEAAHKGRKPA